MRLLIDEDKDLISKLKEGNEEVLKQVYQANEQGFIKWATYHFTVDVSQAQDVFQLSVIALYQNAQKGSLQTLTCSLKTYLFSIGRKLLLKLKRKEIRSETVSYEDIRDQDIPDEIYASLTDDSKLHSVVDMLGEPCRTILQKFYFHELSMQEITKETGYKSEAVVRKKKHQCMQKLKKVIADHKFKIEDFLS